MYNPGTNVIKVRIEKAMLSPKYILVLFKTSITNIIIPINTKAPVIIYCLILSLKLSNSSSIH